MHKSRFLSRELRITRAGAATPGFHFALSVRPLPSFKTRAIVQPWGRNVPGQSDLKPSLASIRSLVNSVRAVVGCDPRSRGRAPRRLPPRYVEATSPPSRPREIPELQARTLTLEGTQVRPTDRPFRGGLSGRDGEAGQAGVHSPRPGPRLLRTGAWEEKARAPLGVRPTHPRSTPRPQIEPGPAPGHPPPNRCLPPRSSGGRTGHRRPPGTQRKQRKR